LQLADACKSGEDPTGPEPAGPIAKQGGGYTMLKSMLKTMLKSEILRAELALTNSDLFRQVTGSIKARASKIVEAGNANTTDNVKRIEKILPKS